MVLKESAKGTETEMRIWEHKISFVGYIYREPSTQTCAHEDSLGFSTRKIGG